MGTGVFLYLYTRPPFLGDAIDFIPRGHRKSKRGNRLSNDMYAAGFFCFAAVFSVYVVRGLTMCNRCIGRENVVVVVRSPPPVVYQPHTCIVTGTESRACSTAAVVPLLLCTAV